MVKKNRTCLSCGCDEESANSFIKGFCVVCVTCGWRWSKEWKIENFNIKEKWGKPVNMSAFLICALDRVRQKIGKPFVIHCGYESSGHASKSYHYKGQAVDFHVDGIALYAAYHELNKLWWFGGIGIYPHWNKPGFHLDVGPYRRWARNSEGRYTRIVNGVFQEEAA